MTEVVIGSGKGPYDIADVIDVAGLQNSHLDLGSVLIPVVEGGQVTVEMSADHQPQAVYLVTSHGRITISAFAAPRSGGLWRDVVGELTQSLHAEGAQTSKENGYWGQEIVAAVTGGTHRFVGVDGPRWMVRGVASSETATADDLALLVRAVLAETVVRRGNEPLPPREPLPVTLPDVLAEQVAAAQMHNLASEDGEEALTDGQALTNVADGDHAGDDNVDVFAADSAATGAQAQIAHAQVVTEFDEAPAEAEPQPQPRSSGSGMQRLGRRKKR